MPAPGGGVTHVGRSDRPGGTAWSPTWGTPFVGAAATSGGTRSDDFRGHGGQMPEITGLSCADSGELAYLRGDGTVHLFFNDPRVLHVTRHRRLGRPSL